MRHDHRPTFHVPASLHICLLFRSGPVGYSFGPRFHVRTRGCVEDKERGEHELQAGERLNQFPFPWRKANSQEQQSLRTALWSGISSLKGDARVDEHLLAQYNTMRMPSMYSCLALLNKALNM